MSEEEGPIPPSVHKWIGVIGLVVAPTTLVTGLCYYFGYTATRKTLAYLGIDSDAVGFTTNDYVTKSTGVLFVTALASLLVCTALLGLCAYLRRVADSGQRIRMLRIFAWSLVVLGVVAMVRGVVGVMWTSQARDRQLWLTPVALGVGAGLLLLGAWIFRIVRPEAGRPPPTAVERALFAVAVAVVVLAAFWTTNIFATKAGEVDGNNAAGSLWSNETTVILDTSDRLFLPEELIKTSQLTDAASPQGETFRYECFRGYAVRGDLWVLLPANWRPEFGYAVLVRTDPVHRITLRTIKGAPDRMGGEANVREYWPCPELVRTVNGPEVQTHLLPAAEVSRILGAADLSVSNEFYKDPSADGITTQNCVDAVDSTLQAVSSETGYKKRYGRELSGRGRESPLWVQESVIEFDTPRRAGEFAESTKSAWLGCGDSDVPINRNGNDEQYRIGKVTDETGLVVTEITSPDKCLHGVGAKSNVVVDVKVCGTATYDNVKSLVDAIRDRFPE
ncbi:sensor domain-containing protein [Mycolicibacterium sp. XJ870]